MSHEETFKYPRLYVEQPLRDKGVIALSAGQAHYLHNVLRRKDGDAVRLFNGKDGEWLGRIKELSKKNGTVALKEQLLPQPQEQRRIHAIFCPIKKHRMDWMIEKAVELGVTDFHPILSQNTEVRKINEERIHQQIFEAAEQCERLEIPVLHGITKIENLLATWNKDLKILSCIERFDTKPIQDIQHKGQDIAFLIGPEGGFTAEEKKLLSLNSIAVGLGDTILRCETALVKALVLLNP